MLALRRFSLGRTSLAAVCVLHVACSDMFEHHYSTKIEAEKAGEVKRGWLPAYLPDGTRDIHLIYNIDTNQAWSAFHFPLQEGAAFRELLTEMSPTEASSKSVRSPNVSWWPKLLEGKLEPGAIGRTGFELYKNGSIIFAIDWRRGQAFYYCDGS